MSNDYLWDRSGIPDLDVKWLEELLAPLAHDAPLDELRLAKGRRHEPTRATAQESPEAPRASGRMKGTMNFFDKRIIGTATLTAAICLFGVTLYERHDHARASYPRFIDPHTDAQTATRTHPLAWSPPALPVAPMTGADLAITAGESARIHVPFGAVDVEIQSSCNADVEMSIVTFGGLQVAHPGDIPTFVAGPRSESHALGGDPLIAGTDTPDGRAHTYHLVPVPPEGMVQYTSQCAGGSQVHGVIEIDRDDAQGPIGPITNARVFNDADEFAGTPFAEHAIRVFGTVLPGAIVSIGGKQLTLQPPDPDRYDLPVAPRFSAEVPISAEHPVVAVRVDDAMGTHFYVSRRSITMVPSCETTISEPKQTAARLDAQGKDADALRTLEAATKTCTPDRDTVSLALEYACKAGDVDAARTFWRKLPHELQRSLEPTCSQHSIMRAQLDAP
jgi:hypothetical protein